MATTGAGPKAQEEVFRLQSHVQTARHWQAGTRQRELGSEATGSCRDRCSRQRRRECRSVCKCRHRRSRQGMRNSLGRWSRTLQSHRNTVADAVGCQPQGRLAPVTSVHVLLEAGKARSVLEQLATIV